MRLDIHIQLISVRHFLEHLVCSQYLQIYLFQGKESGDSIQQVQLQKKRSNCKKKRVEVSVPYSCCTSIKKIWWTT